MPACRSRVAVLYHPGTNAVECIVLNLGAGSPLLIIAVNTLLSLVDGDFALDVILSANIQTY